MYIITINTQENGGRPALQTWDELIPPEGYALCPEEYYAVFYSTSPAGFVNIKVEDGVVTAMEVNQEALDLYIAENPIVEKSPTQAKTDVAIVYDEMAEAYLNGVQDA